MKKHFLFLFFVLTSLAGTAQAINADLPASIAKMSAFGTTPSQLTLALAASNEVDIDKNITINTTIVIPSGKTVNVREGIIISGTGKLLIRGTFNGGRTRKFADGFNVKFAPYAVKDYIYPEWWGAVPMVNPLDTSIGGANNVTDCTKAFLQAINCVEAAANGSRFYTVSIYLSGAYALTDELTIRDKTIDFVGRGQGLEGSGLKYCGSLTKASVTKSLLKFTGASFSTIQNMWFKGKRTTDPGKRMLAAIHILREDNSSLTQRGHHYENINIGDFEGYFLDRAAGYDFDAGIYSGGGIDNNNDFFTITNLNILGVRAGIRINNSMSVQWVINQYQSMYVGWMYESNKGGSFTGNSWFCNSAYEGVIHGPDNTNYGFRFKITDISSEHLECNYFLKSDAATKMEVSTGFIASAGNQSGDGFGIIAGSCMKQPSEFKFSGITFTLDQGGKKKLYMDATGTNPVTKFMLFENCTGVEDIFFKLDPSGGNSDNITNVQVIGRKVFSQYGYGSNLSTTITSRNPLAFISDKNKWLSMDAVFKADRGEVTFGQRGISPCSDLKVKSFQFKTVGALTNTIKALLPGNANILGVDLVFAQNMTGLSIGDGSSIKKFGTVNGGTGNGKTNAVNVIYNSNTNLVITGQNQIPAGVVFLVTITYLEHGLYKDEIGINLLLNILPKGEIEEAGRNR